MPGFYRRPVRRRHYSSSGGQCLSGVALNVGASWQPGAPAAESEPGHRLRIFYPLHSILCSLPLLRALQRYRREGSIDQYGRYFVLPFELGERRNQAKVPLLSQIVEQFRHERFARVLIRQLPSKFELGDLLPSLPLLTQLALPSEVFAARAHIQGFARGVRQFAVR